MSMQKALEGMKKTCYLQINPEDTELKDYVTKAFKSPSHVYFGDILRHFYRAMRPRLIKEMELNQRLLLQIFHMLEYLLHQSQ